MTRRMFRKLKATKQKDIKNERKCRRKGLDKYDERKKAERKKFKELVKTKKILRSYDAKKNHVE